MRSSACRGLVNMGNTCYMNAVLQAVAHNPLFQHEYFIVRGHNTTICEQRRRREARDLRVQDPSGSLVQMEPCIGCEISSLMQTLFPAPRATLTARHLTSPFVPQSFMETFWSAVPSFMGSQQQDAHEFLISLLNSIHSSTCSRVLSKSSSKQEDSLQSPRFTPSGRSLCDCIVHQNFAGVFNSEISCVFCDTVSSKFDPFLDITLSLDSPVTTPRKSGNSVMKDLPSSETSMFSLTSLLRRFTVEERLKGQDMIYCLRCARYVDAIKRLVIHKLPNLLIFHLGRFDFAKKRKIMDAVSFPTRGLDLREFCSDADAPIDIATPVASHSSRKDKVAAEVFSGRSSPVTPSPTAVTPDAVYDLAAVISHHGDSVDGGHFTAFVHSSQDSVEAETTAGSDCSWLHFDDSSVQRVSTEEVEASQAYLLFYVRRHLFH